MRNRTLARIVSAFLASLFVILSIPFSVFAYDADDSLPTQFTDPDDTAAGDASDDADVTSDPDVKREINVYLPEELNKTFESSVGDIITTGDGFRLQKNEGEESYCIISYIGSAKNVDIPDSYKGVPITRIGDSAFFRNGRMEKITLSENITSMGIDVFFGCDSLQYNIYEGGRYLGTADNAYFYYVSPDDKNIAEATVHPDTRIIAKYAFRACYELTSVTVSGDNIIQMGYGMVFDCPKLESLTIPFVGEKKNSTNNAHFGYIFGSRTYGGNISYVPRSLRTLTVNGGNIAKSALYGVDMIESLTVPELSGGYLSYFFGGESYEDNIVPVAIKNVTVNGGEIKAYAFYRCTGVVSVTLKDSVTNMGGYAFQNCSSLASITIGNGVIKIGNYAFQNCSSLTDIIIPDNVTSIGRSAFYNCRSLTSITIPNSVTSIGEDAFSGCGSLASITIPDGITNICSNTFYGCKSLTSITIPDGVTNVGNSAFYGCSSLTSITIPDGVTNVGNSAFYGCSSLTSITIPDSVTSIGDSTFKGCSGLTSITIPDGVTSIGNGAFSYCTKLTDITIPNGVTSIGRSTFAVCCSLTSVTIPDGVISIDYRAFFNCERLMSITIPDSVTSIGELAFSYCYSLTNITIPESVTSIGNGVFEECSSLTSITIPDGVTSIGDEVFKNCDSLTSITIPDGVTSIGKKAFLGCSSITIYCKAQSQPSGWNDKWNPDNRPVVWGYTGESDVSSDYIEEHDSKESLENNHIALFSSETGSAGLSYSLNADGVSYSVSKGRCTDSEIIIPSSYNGLPVTSIGAYAFDGYSGLVSITIPDSVTSIGYYAFDGCKGLVSITIPDSMTSIGSGAFYGCSSLTSITIPESVTNLGDGAFCGCISLTSITIPNGVTSIGSSAFSGCSGLTSITIPESVTHIYYAAFKNCSSLTSITIPNSVTSIGDNAFYGCSSLTSITIPDSVTSTGEFAFNFCSRLTSITIGSGVTSIGRYAFNNCNSLYVIYNNSNLDFKIGSFDYGYLAYCAKMVINKDGTIQYRQDEYNYLIDGKFLFREDGGKYELIAYIGEDADLILPDSINGVRYETYDVRGIVNITSLYIPSGINIGYISFQNCQYLTSVIIPSGAEVGEKAFADCKALASVTLTGVRRLRSSVFSGCKSLSELIYEGEENEWRFVIKSSDWDSGMGAYTINGIKPNSGLYYETDNAVERFYISGYSGSNSDAVAPEKYSGRSVVAVLPSAFYGNTTLISLRLPNTLEYIGDSAFKNCINLRTVNIPSGVKSLEFGVFAGCESLTMLSDIPMIAGDYFGYFFGAYSYKESESAVPAALDTVSVRAGSTISDHAFENCTYIKRINLSSVSDIGAYAFANCKSLDYMEIPSGITEIKEHTFSGCSSVQSIYLPAGIRYIGKYAFSECISLISNSIIPNTVETVDDFAFSGCLGLSVFDIPDSVTRLGNGVLDGCVYIREIALGKGLRLENIADYSEGMTTESGRQVNGSPFLGIDKSRSLLERYEVADDHPQLMTDAYGVLYEKMTVDAKVIEIAVIDAPAMANLSSYALPDYIVEICPYAFAYSMIRSVDLEYVRLIGNHAFFSATDLIYVNLSDPAESNTAFLNEVEKRYETDGNGTDDSKKVKYSQYIRNSAFMGCTSLQNVNLSTEMIVGVEELAFADCPMMTSVLLGKNIKVIGLRAFGTTGAVESNLEFFWVDDDNTCFKSIDGVLYRKNSDGLLTLLVYPACAPVQVPEVSNGKINYDNYTSEYREEFSVPNGVSAIESYAFETVRKLKSISVKPNNDIRIGDYAFADSILERIILGDRVISIGLKRGEGEYTVFSGCDYLVNIDVTAGNDYYCSKNGVLFNKDKSVLLKYPVQKTGTVYTLPNTVTAIASMAFKDNNLLSCVVIESNVAVIGLEAFYNCSHLSLIYFNRVYAPTMVMENAFTTFVSVDASEDDFVFNPRTRIGYSDGYYENGRNGEKGWKNYEDSYTIAKYDRVPDFDIKKTGGHYAVVVVDSSGVRLGNTRVSLTDSNGTNETVDTIEGIATFTDLFGKTGYGLTVDYDLPYSVMVYDDAGEYFKYTNPSFYLDEEMRVTYITLTKTPSAYGVSCGDTDINSETAEINQHEYGYVYDATTVDEVIGYADESTENKGQKSETVPVSVIGYCDQKTGWNFNAALSAIYQNGRLICTASDIEILDGAALLTFELPVKNLVPEVAIETRLVASKGGEANAECSTALNIHVFNFDMTVDDVKIDDSDLSIDIGKAGEIFTKLFGSSSMNVNIGKNLAISAQTNGSEITFNFDARTSKTKNKTYGSYKEGYEYYAGARAHNKNTYLFTFSGKVKDSDGITHNLIYNIRFARDHETEGYFYYRCYIYEGTRGINYKNEIQTFYGAVNSKAAVARGRSGLTAKAYLIYLSHFASAKNAKDIDKIKKLGKDAQYIEALASTPYIENNSAFNAKLSGEFVFKYDKDTFIKPVSGEIKGELAYTFRHNSQFMVWVIPVVLEVEVSLKGEVKLTLKADSWDSIRFNEIKMTLSAEIAAQLGVGCSVASVGVYGSIGTVFVLDFYPNFGVEKWTLNGEIGVYVKVLWWKKKFAIGEWKNVNLLGNNARNLSAPMMQAAYVVDGYTRSEPDELPENPMIAVSGDTIYKIYTLNAQMLDLQKYDEYNCCKLAIARWDSALAEWKFIGLLDDNGYNDMAYSVNSTSDSIEITYTQQSNKMNAANADDIYASTETVIVKRAVIENNSADINVEAISESGSYKYLVSSYVVEGTPIVVWAENSDGNMFGVSPMNYIDANGASHIFRTSANSIWISKFENGAWTSPRCIRDGLSAIVGLAVDGDGDISYVVDENGDLADIEDRVMYLFDGSNGALTAVNNPADGSIVNISVYQGDVMYYYQSADPNLESGLCTLDKTALDFHAVILENENFANDFRYIYNADGSTLGIIYSANKAWQSDEGNSDGSALYGVFYENGKWGQPVELSCYTPSDGIYIDHFDGTVMQNDNEILILLDLSDRDGNKIGSITVTQPISSNAAVTGFEIDYENRTLSFNIRNNGLRKATIYISIDGEAPDKLVDGIESGKGAIYAISLQQYDTHEHGIVLFDERGTVIFDDRVDLSYSDLVPYVKHLVIGNRNKLLVAVANHGNLSNGGTVIIRRGNHQGENLQIDNLDALIAENNVTYGSTVPVIITGENGSETVWLSRVYVSSGDIVYIEVPIEDADGLDSNMISVSVKPDLGELNEESGEKEIVEKGNASDNNQAYWSYKGGTGIVTTLDGTVPDGMELCEIPKHYGTDKSRYEFDREAPSDIEIAYICASDSRLISIRDETGNILNAESAFIDEAESRIVLSKIYLSTLGYGDNKFTADFSDGSSSEFFVYSVRYYTVTWNDSDGNLLMESKVSEGKLPFCEIQPTREASAEYSYTFAGWDTDGDGQAEPLSAVNSDLKLTAVFTAAKREYEVKWIFRDGINSTQTISEKYFYGDMPEYKGIVISPENETFTSWDKSISQVTGNAEYTACYNKTASGTMIFKNTPFETSWGMKFTTTISVSGVTDMTQTVVTMKFDSAVAALVSYTCRENVTVISESEGELTIAICNMTGDADMPILDMVFRTGDAVDIGEHSFVDIVSKDTIVNGMSSMNIYQKGDVNMDGKVNVRDLNLIRQHMLKIIVLSDVQKRYANVYMDFDIDGVDIINVRDLNMLRQYILNIITVIPIGEKIGQ